MNTHRHLLVTLAAGISLTAAACSQTSTTTADTAATPSETAATTDTAGMDSMATPAATGTASAEATKFLTDAMKGDNSEVRVGTLAAEKGASQGVKDYGRMLASDHSGHKAKLLALASSLGVSPTEATKPEADALYKKLQGLSGAAFDKAYIAGMVEDHKKDIAAYKKEADRADPAALGELAKQTVPTLEKHLATAEKLQKGM